MASRYSVATGNKSSTAVWSATSGGAPGASVPGTGDTAYIETGTVTVDSAWPLKALVLGKSGATGALVMNYDVTFDDASGAGLTIKAASGFSFTTNATAAAPRLFKSASSSPTNPWTISYEKQDAVPDDRTLDFDFVYMTGNLWMIGNSTYYVNFNAGTTDAPFLRSVTPVSRDTALDNHFIEGRATSRIYNRGTWAGVATASGRLAWSGFAWQTLLELCASGQRFACFSKYVHLPHCRFDQQPRFKPKPGSLYLDVDMTLIEDK